MRSSLIFALCGLFSFAEAASKVELNAQEINSTHESLNASSDVMAFVNESSIKAQQVHYDKNQTTLRLQGNVNILEYDQKNIISAQMNINTQDKNASYDDIFITTQEDFWLYSRRIDRQGEEYRFGKSIFSSCCIQSPDWIMGVERSLYDTNSSKMKLYHTKIYVGNTPIFYFPYLSFSTKQERSSGLLFPTMSYNSKEGFIYEQPIYIAPYANWDLELNPQIRTKRSQGGYATLRFKDTPNSYGSLRLGYFKDNAEFIETYDLRNDSHYGLQFQYDSSDFLHTLKPKGFKDGLYTNLTFLNDIDYLNLQKDQMVSLLGTNSYIRESRFNYFLYNDNYYMGLYGKYFIDTRKSDTDNDDTIQELPTLHLHKSTQSIYDNLLYSIDLKSYNYYRKSGVRAKKVDFFLPLSYSKSFLNDYLTFEVSQNLYASKAYFSNKADLALDSYRYSSLYTQVELSSELTHIYQNYTHTIRPFVQYINPTQSDESVTQYEELDDEAKELFSINQVDQSLLVGFTHYLYQKRGKLKFYHRLLYAYYTDQKQGDIRNEIGYYGSNFTIYNNFIYSQEHKQIKSSLSSIRFRGGDLSVGTTFYYNDNFINRQTKTLGLNFKYSFNEHLNILGGLTYDFEKDYKTQWRVGFKYDRDCWSISALFKEDLQPILTTTGADSQENRSFIFEFNIVPFGGIKSN